MLSVDIMSYSNFEIIMKNSNFIEMKAWGADIYMPTTMYEVLKTNNPSNEHIAELAISWGSLCMSAKPEPIYSALVGTSFEVTTDLLAFPTNTNAPLYYGMFDVDRVFGANGVFTDPIVICGICAFNITPFDTKIQKALLGLLEKKLIGTKNHFLIIVQSNHKPKSRFYIATMTEQIHLLSNTYAPDIVLDIESETGISVISD